MKKLILILTLNILNCANLSQSDINNLKNDINGIKKYIDSITPPPAQNVPVVVPPTVPQPPAAPTGITTLSGNTQNTISWQPVTGATSYNIYFAMLPGVTKLNGTQISNAVSPHTHMAQLNSTTTYYVMTSVNSNGESTESVEVHSTAGVIDNHNGTVSVLAQNLIWPKCGQINALGANTYNVAKDDCSGGTQGLMAYCVTGDWSCVDPINPTYLNGMGNSEVWQSCHGLALSNFAGRSTWRVPTTIEFHAMQAIYVKNLQIWGGLAVGRYWIGDAFPWYAIGIDDNMETAPTRAYPWYVICVGM